MSQDPSKSRRERSRGRPGVSLAECEELCRAVESKGLDGLSAAEIASGLGYHNIKTNTFSAALSSSLQLGLLERSAGRHTLTSLAKSILGAVDPSAVSRLRMSALRRSPLYSDLIDRYEGKRLPDLEILANLLQKQYGITSSAKQPVARAFLDSLRHAAVIGDDQFLRGHSDSRSVPAEPPPATPTPARRRAGETRIDLRLWGEDEGKIVRVRAPDSMSEESFERLVLALRLLVRSKPPER